MPTRQTTTPCKIRTTPHKLTKLNPTLMHKEIDDTLMCHIYGPAMHLVLSVNRFRYVLMFSTRLYPAPYLRPHPLTTLRTAPPPTHPRNPPPHVLSRVIPHNLPARSPPPLSAPHHANASPQSVATHVPPCHNAYPPHPIAPTTIRTAHLPSHTVIHRTMCHTRSTTTTPHIRRTLISH